MAQTFAAGDGFKCSTHGAFRSGCYECEIERIQGQLIETRAALRRKERAFEYQHGQAADALEELEQRDAALEQGQPVLAACKLIPGDVLRGWEAGFPEKDWRAELARAELARRGHLLRIVPRVSPSR